MKPISFPLWLALLLSFVPVMAVRASSPLHAQQVEVETELPAVATITDLINGDLACYVDLVDGQGNPYQGLYATFEVCEQAALIGQTVKLIYQPASFNDCDSNEPCGKSKTELAIVQIEPWEN
ncbi:hypothetical protein IQ219_04280 [Synechocystis sp. LEGE 06083]|uniref:hypothetical protein n=1 Tax=Synechocystis sp. LEGE 06083 TaxID=915336 RepID=UPI0018828CE2|nr:hypothetical protein [Synechocystis sp. LEGE 06083]MBE9194550.1 hypothetical protein [Synechocystis sp. LEGE 06083]